MSKRRRHLFRRKSGFSVNPRRPISARTKTAYGMAAVSIALFAAVLLYAIYMDGESGKVAGGIGVVFLALELFVLAESLSHVRDEAEPLLARILAVFLSVVSVGMWGSIYVVGLMRL